MQKQLRIIPEEQSKGKSAGKVCTASDELQYMIDFNRSINQAMTMTVEHLSDFVFMSMNLTLARQD